jgi:hypothetical protein
MAPFEHIEEVAPGLVKNQRIPVAVYMGGHSPPPRTTATIERDARADAGPPSDPRPYCAHEAVVKQVVQQPSAAGIYNPFEARTPTARAPHRAS